MCITSHRGEASMEKARIIGVDLAKRAFQLHGATADGQPVLRKKVSRAQLLSFLAGHPRAVVAMEACATAHGWGRAIQELGHDVRLIPPIYVKPFVGRQKNDAADAAAIAWRSWPNPTDSLHRWQIKWVINPESVPQLPLIERKERLRSLLGRAAPVRFADHVLGEGPRFREQSGFPGLCPRFPRAVGARRDRRRPARCLA